MNQFAFLITTLLTLPTFATWEPPRIEDHCLIMDLRYTEAPLFRTKAVGDEKKIPLYKKKSRCANEKECKDVQMKAYLLPGDIVLGGPEDKGFRCCYYGSERGKLTAGFIPVTQLEPYEEKEELSQDFLAGKWIEFGDSIEITRVGTDKVKAHGNAIWQGYGSPHIGEFEATSAWNAKTIAFKDEDCEVKMLRRAQYLMVDDNRRCGGMNVAFSGIYLKVKDAK